MNRILFALAAASTMAAFAAEPQPSAVAKMYDGQLKIIEQEIVSLAEAMPAEKYDFAPTGGEFKGVRTFSQQMTHVAAVMYMVSAAVLVEKNPSESGPGENGPASIKGKEAVVKYLKDAFAYAHKAMGTLTSQNETDLVPSAFGNQKTARAGMASVAVWHSFDHYGQAVVYARMNSIVPPASRQ